MKSIEAKVVHKARGIKMLQDEEGRLYELIHVEPGLSFGFWDCWKHSKEICGHNLHRPHWSCIHCRFRAVANGRMPPVIRVGRYTLYVWHGRPHEGIKSILLKKVLELAEFLAN